MHAAIDCAGEGRAPAFEGGDPAENRGGARTRGIGAGVPATGARVPQADRGVRGRAEHFSRHRGPAFLRGDAERAGIRRGFCGAGLVACRLLARLRPPAGETGSWLCRSRGGALAEARALFWRTSARHHLARRGSPGSVFGRGRFRAPDSHAAAQRALCLGDVAPANHREHRGGARAMAGAFSPPRRAATRSGPRRPPPPNRPDEKNSAHHPAGGGHRVRALPGFSRSAAPPANGRGAGARRQKLDRDGRPGRFAHLHRRHDSLRCAPPRTGYLFALAARGRHFHGWPFLQSLRPRFDRRRCREDFLCPARGGR